jgi:hypothetical protein
MLNFSNWMEARKPKKLDKAPGYSTYNLPRSQVAPQEAVRFLQAFEAGNTMPLEVVADALEEAGHPSAPIFRSPELMAKAHFMMALPSGHDWNAPHATTFKNYLLDRYREFFKGMANNQWKMNYRSAKGQREHGQMVSFLHDLIYNPERVKGLSSQT